MWRSLRFASLLWAIAFALPVPASVASDAAGTKAGAGSGTTAAPAMGEGDLSFVRDGKVVSDLDLAAVRKSCPEEVVAIDDPYYGGEKHFRACPLADVLKAGFGSTDALAGADVLLRARDGYTKPTTGSRLLEPGGFLAFADADLTPPDATPKWDPIDRRQVDPGPFYMVWQKPGQTDPNRYPWPYQLATIEIASLATEYPHIVPTGAAPGSPAQHGYDIFKSECVACHAINGEGGRVGPDLNVPRSVVEYRPEDQIKAYIRNPQSFRYTSMPPHPNLNDADLDALVHYFRTMSGLKRDPGKSS
jgi:mono/diheme cytochrome c family protein